MKLVSDSLGDVDYKEDDVITFSDGIPGFVDEKKFVFVCLDPLSPFLFMQSVKSKDLCLVIADPFYFFRDYEFEIPEGVKEQLEIAAVEDVQVRNVVVVKDPFDKSTINLKAPVIINMRTKKAKQMVLNTNHYVVRHLLFNQMTAKASNE